MTDPSPSIFVQIAAYRDPDLPATLHNLIERAAQPERLRFGICLQLSDSDPAAWNATAFPQDCNLALIPFRAEDSRGACWARHQAQQLYRGEDFLLQIDSHMRAVQNWDDDLVKTWEACLDPKAVLSVYPNGFQLPCSLQLNTLPVMAAHRFDDFGILKFQGISRYQLPEQQPATPLPNAFMAGGFLFGPGCIVPDVPYDPSLYFYGEEVSMSARLWTHGFNLYSPHRLLLFHLYKSSSNVNDASATHWSDHSDWFLLNRRSLVRVHALLGTLETLPQDRLRPTPDDVNDLDRYGLGAKRSLDDYQRWAGVDFAGRTISESASEGRFSR